MQNYLLTALVAAAAGLFAGIAFQPKTPGEIPSPRYVAYKFPIVTTSLRQVALDAMERRVETLNPPSAMDLGELAGHYLERGRTTGDTLWLERAEAAAKKSLALLPSPNGARLILAQLAGDRHEFREAIRLSQEFLRDRGGVAAYPILINAHAALGENEEASRFADELVDALPTSGSFFLRALANASLGRDLEAVADFERAAEREQGDNLQESSRLRSLWGRFYLRKGRLDDADRLFAEAVRITPGNPLALALSGELALRRGNPRRGASLFMAAFSSSKQPRFLVLYGRAKAQGGDERAATEAREQAEKLLRPDIVAKRYGHRLDLVELLLDRGRKEDFVEAVKLSEEESRVRASSDARFALARSYALAGMNEQAIAVLRALLREGSRTPEYYVWAAKVERARKRGPQADFFGRLALELDPRGASLSSIGGNL